MTVHISVALEEGQLAQLEAIAEARQETAVDVVAEALTRYLDYEMAFRAAVEEGLAAERAGDTSDFADYARDLRRRMAIKIAKSET